VLIGQGLSDGGGKLQAASYNAGLCRADRDLVSAPMGMGDSFRWMGVCCRAGGRLLALRHASMGSNGDSRA